MVTEEPETRGRPRFPVFHMQVYYLIQQALLQCMVFLWISLFGGLDHLIIVIYLLY